VAFEEDLSIFLADFGVPATLDGQAVRCIFDATTADPLGGMPAAQPQVQLPTQYVPSNAIGKLLTLAGADYLVRDHQPDGTGMSQLLLTKA
jgi:hypothetical protein